MGDPFFYWWYLLTLAYKYLKRKEYLSAYDFPKGLNYTCNCGELNGLYFWVRIKPMDNRTVCGPKLKCEKENLKKNTKSVTI